MIMGISELVNESISVTDLEERLRNQGHVFKSGREFADYVLINWTKEKEPYEKQIVAQANGLSSFPCREYQNGTFFFVKGIVHGDYLPFMEMHGGLMKSLREFTSYFNNPKDGNYVFCEESMSSLIGIEKSFEIKDVSLGQPRHFSRPESSFIKDFYNGFRYVFMPDSFRHKLLIRSLRSVEDLAKYGAIYDLYELPGQLEPELAYLRQTDGHPVDVLREKYTANCLLKFAKETSARSYTIYLAYTTA